MLKYLSKLFTTLFTPTSHAGQLIMMSVYGILVESRHHKYITTAQSVMDAVSDAARPGAWLVDAFPICMLSSLCSLE